MDHVINMLNAIPAEAWTVVGLLVAGFAGRHAWLVAAARAIVAAADAQHPQDHGAQLEHVERAHGRKAAAKRAAKVIRRRMEAQRPTPEPSLVDRIHDGTTMPDALPQVVPTPLEPGEFDLGEQTPSSKPTVPDSVPPRGSKERRR